MNLLINFMAGFLSLFLTGDAKQKQSKVQMAFKEKLQVIASVVNGDGRVDAYQINNSILFLERATLILSESDGNFLGRFQPTMRDYKSWANWFKRNKNRLYWDDIKHSIKVKVQL